MVIFLLIQAVTQAPPAERQLTTLKQEIVVVGRRYRDELADCIARSCPPEQEVEVAMNAATETFRAGRYEEAKAMLARAVSRNKRYAARMPAKMSDLYATYADVGNHEGDDKLYLRATYDSVNVLRDNLGADHPATRAVAPRLGDMMVKLGRTREADALYRESATVAKEHGDTRMATRLTFRRASLAFQQKNYVAARTLVSDMERDAGMDQGVVALADLLRAQIAFANHEGTFDQIAEASRKLGGGIPALIYSPRYDMTLPGDGMDQASSSKPFEDLSKFSRPIDDDHRYYYVDVGFWIKPDGRVEDIRIVQPVSGSSWARPILSQIAGRRYSQTAGSVGGTGFYRLERFTLRPVYGIPTGSHIRARIGQPTLQVIDMTAASGRVEEDKPN